MSSPDKPSLFRRILRHRVFLPSVFFLVLIAVFVFSSQFTARPPEIEGIAPPVGNPGSIMVISGHNFGETRQGGEVSIAGARLTSDSYREWSDERISVRIPETVGSGRVFVTTRSGKSNGVLFTNKQHIPVILSGPLKPGYPYISSIDPMEGSVGTPVTIEGLNFGFEKGDGRIYFTAAGTVEESRQTGNQLAVESIADSAEDFDCESWTDQEIRVYVPDGAVSGNVRVQTDRGMSNAVYFEVTGMPGTKLYTDSMGYQISYGVEVRNIIADAENSLDIWFPGVYRGLKQRNVEVINEPEPLWDNLGGLQRYHFENIDPEQDLNIQVTAWLERYAIETKVTVSRVRANYNTERALYKVYTTQNRIIPVQDKEIIRIASAAAGRERNPYLKAKRLYDYLLENLEFTRTPVSRDPLQNLAEGVADSYTFAIVFCAALRSQGIPARPVSGYLVYGDKIAVKHFWAEFYLENFGWIPADLSLGAGARYGNFPDPTTVDAAGYYFGNLDNRHITFSRGLMEVKPAGTDTEVRYRERLYSLQTIFEEYTGISEYDAYYRDINIIEWW